MDGEIRPNETWSEYCLRNIPKGKVCHGCFFRTTTPGRLIFCNLFLIATGDRRPEICLKNKAFYELTEGGSHD